MSPIELPRFSTISETAHALRCHPDTVAALIKRGELKAVRLGRAIRVVSESINALANRNDHGSTATQGAANVEHN